VLQVRRKRNLPEHQTVTGADHETKSVAVGSEIDPCDLEVVAAVIGAGAEVHESVGTVGGQSRQRVSVG